MNVRVVVPFNPTLEAPNALARVGGITVGGGEQPEDPPLHPRVPKKFAVASRSPTNRDICWKERFLGPIPAIMVRFHRILVRLLV